MVWGLKSKWKQTAEFIDMIDSLFDCFNADNCCGPKQYRRPFSKTSCHKSYLLKCRDTLSAVNIVGSKVKVPCIDGFILSINFVIGLFNWSTESGCPGKSFFCHQI